MLLATPGRAGVVQDRVLRGGRVQLGLGREAGLVEPRGEGVAQDDPLALRRRGGLLLDVGEGVLQASG